MLWREEWPLLRTPLLNTRFLEVPVDCLLGGVWCAGNKKLLSSNLWIDYDRTSYKPVVPNRKNGGCTIAFRSDTGGLVSRVFVDGPNRRITKAFHTSNCCKLDAMIARTHDSRPCIRRDLP